MIDLANDPLYKAAVAKHWADKKAAAETPLAKFLEPSEVKQRMYHGTGQDIRQFKPKQAGASFVTPDPKFAHDFADLSESWMKRNAGTILTGEQIQRAKDLVAQDLNRRARALMHDSPNGEVARIGSPQASEFSKTQYANRLAEQLPSAQNIMPVHVQAKKPFDYENPKHIHAVRTMLHKLGHTQHIDDFDTAMRGGKGDDANWHTIESKPVQQAIRALGHDSFWVKEGGVKNLGVYNPGAIKSAIGNRGTYDTEDYDVNKAQGGAVKPVKLKEGQQPPYQDPKTKKIDDWKWHPMERIRQELSARRELPEHVTPYADYMREMNAKAQAGKLTPRDLVKAYTITQSSIGRGGLSHATATKRGMKLPNTGGEVRPEGAFAEWLGSPMGQKYLEASMRGEEHPEAMEDLRAKFAPFGKQNAQVEAMQYATQNAPSLGERLNKAITGSKADYRKYAGGIKGIAGAKSGFIGSLLGRGDLPTLDARQLNLHSLSHPTKTPEGMMSRGKGLGGQEAVDRLIARQDALGYKIPKELAPYAQHLIHHDVWDQRGGTKTTHEDLIKAMRGYADGGDVEQMRQQITAAQRAAAGNKAAAMIKKTPQVKLSEALGNLNVEGRGELTSTQADRTRVGGGNIGGPAFSALGLADPNYAGNAWGVMDAGTASRLTNLNKPDTIWTPMLGSAEQLKTNPIVFDKMGKAFRNQVKAGKLSPELRIAINAKLAPLFGEDTDITKPKFWQGIDTFDKRAAVADALMGKQLGGELRGGAIIPATDILKSETEPTLMHPLHGGVTPTYALGPRLFKMTGKTEYRPDLHPGFPTLLKGEDLGHNVHPTETQIALPDWHERFKQLYPNRKAPPGYYDLALGFKGEGLPSQKITEAYLKHLQKHGRAAGGPIGYAKGGNVSMDEMLAHTTLGKKAPNVRNIGADEAPDMKVKQYIPPGPSNGLGLPAGGVDFQPEMPGQQLSQAAPAGPGGPAMPGMPGMPPGAPGMPPGGPGPGMPGMPPPLPRNQPGMPTGKPAGLEPPNIPPPKQKPTGSNILSMTPQGQALAALGPMRKMAEGGGVKRKVEVRPTVKDETLQRKIPEMETAVKALHAGIIDHAEYDRIVAKHKPVKPYDFVPQPASDKDAARALKDTQKAHWRGAEQWPAGRKVGLRLDIPAYERHGVWVNSIHDEEGKEGDKYNTSYGPVSSVKNATFDPTPSKAVRVATGEQNKSPFARIKGELHPMSEDEAVKHMQEHLHHPDWAQVGMDPRRHGFFYDRKTLQPVTHSEHVVQIGPLVLAKKPKYGKRETYAHGGGVTLPPSTEQMRQALSARRSNSKA